MRLIRVRPSTRTFVWAEVSLLDDTELPVPITGLVVFLQRLAVSGGEERERLRRAPGLAVSQAASRRKQATSKSVECLVIDQGARRSLLMRGQNSGKKRCTVMDSQTNEKREPVTSNGGKDSKSSGAGTRLSLDLTHH